MGVGVAENVHETGVSPGGRSGSPQSWPPRRSRSSELEEGPGHGPDPRFLCPTGLADRRRPPGRSGTNCYGKSERGLSKPESAKKPFHQSRAGEIVTATILVTSLVPELLRGHLLAVEGQDVLAKFAWDERE